MNKIIEEILEMPYYKNYAATSGAVHNISKHEDAVEIILSDSKKGNLNKVSMPEILKPTGEFYKRGPKKGTPKTKPISRKDIRDRWLKGIDTEYMPDNSYIPQPCGTHNNPDFVVKKDGKMFFIECKSAEGAKPVYNSAHAKQNYIYVLCSEEYNATTVFMGQHIVSQKAAELYDARQQDHIEVDKKHDRIFAESGADVNNRGPGYFNRPMYIQEGSKEKTDYFTHKNRSKAENEVREFVS